MYSIWISASYHDASLLKKDLRSRITNYEENERNKNKANSKKHVLFFIRSTRASSELLLLTRDNVLRHFQVSSAIIQSIGKRDCFKSTYSFSVLIVLLCTFKTCSTAKNLIKYHCSCDKIHLVHDKRQRNVCVWYLFECAFEFYLIAAILLKSTTKYCQVRRILVV